MYSWLRSQEIKGAKACKVCILVPTPAFQISIFSYKSIKASTNQYLLWWHRKPAGRKVSIHYYKTVGMHACLVIALQYYPYICTNRHQM